TTIKAEGGEIKPAKDVIEQPVHLTVQRQEWIGLLAPNRDIAPPIPRDKISNAHRSLHCVASLVAWSRHAPRPDKAARSFNRSGRVLVFYLLALGGSVAGFDRHPAWPYRLRHITHARMRQRDTPGA